MKKIAIIILSSLVASVFLSYASPVFAEDDPGTLKIYYSESLGTGEKVMHVTVCNKVQAYAPLTCTKELVNQKVQLFAKQCDEASDVDKMIKGCLIKEGNGYKQIPGTTYNYADPAFYDLKSDVVESGCSDKPEMQAPFYGKLFAVVPDTMEGDDVDEAKIEEELVTYIDAEGTPVATIPAGKTIKAMYKTALCAVYDKPVGGGADQFDPKQRELLSKIEVYGPYEKTMMEDPTSCNNTHHASVLDKEPMVTCSVMERITGKTGTEIFSKYVQRIYTWAAGVVGIIAVLTMVYSGIQISMSADGGSIDEAKNRIMKSIIGLVILFLSGLILYTINPTFFTGG